MALPDHGIDCGWTSSGERPTRGTIYDRFDALSADDAALTDIVGGYGAKLVGSYVDRRPPTEQTVHGEGEYEPGVAVNAPPPRTQHRPKGINPEDL